MNKEKVRGKAHDVAGRIRRQAGEWTGDERLQIEGAGQQLRGKVEGVVGDVKEGVEETMERGREKVVEMRRRGEAESEHRPEAEGDIKRERTRKRRTA